MTATRSGRGSEHFEITYYVACSIDGFIADAEGRLDWLRPFEQTGDDYGYAAFYESVDAVVLGRSTFDFVRDMPEWPYEDKPTWVFSHASLGALPRRAVATVEEPVAFAARLRAHGYRHVYLVGGGRLAASFRAAGLITRYVVSVVPVILGGGLPMIGPGGGVERLECIRSEAFPSGIVQLEYASASRTA